MSRDLSRSILDPDYGREKPDLPAPTAEERRAEFEKMHFELLKAARLVWEKGVSYRGFKVGCAVLAWHPKEGWLVYTAHNFKPVPREERGEDKRCAERNALGAAQNDGCEKIVAIVTVSDQRSTSDDSDTPHGVLHACKDCRDLFKELPIIDGDTILYNANDPDLETDPAGEEIVSPGALPGISPITRKHHQRRAETDFVVVGEERTMEELLSEKA